MQNDLKTAIHFDDFYAVFGPKGIVAMAWWLGAQHANQIRAEHHSFPFLHIEGEVADGRIFLMCYLMKLIGEASPRACAPEHSSSKELARWISKTELPVVILESMPNEKHTFDWDEIRDLYSGGAVGYVRNDQMEQNRFQGALVIVSRQTIHYSAPLESRVTRIQLNAACTKKNRSSVAGVSQLSVQQARIFGLAVRQAQDQTIRTFNKLAPAYTASLLDEHGHQLSARAAKNGGQLMSLVDVLSLLLDLSTEQRLNALNEVRSIVDADLIPY